IESTISNAPLNLFEIANCPLSTDSLTESPSFKLATNLQSPATIEGITIKREKLDSRSFFKSIVLIYKLEDEESNLISAKTETDPIIKNIRIRLIHPIFITILQ